MENLLLPSKIEFSEGEDSSKTTLIVTPCYHGYGTTLGNALRRVLLSSLPGAAVEAFKIRGIQHEFTSIEGVKEDVVEIMLNLKQLIVKLYGDDNVVLNLSKKGKGPVTAKDIEANSNVDILNNDLVFCHLTSDKPFEMEIIVGKGRGFITAEEKDRGNYDLGTIVIDSIYTPVKDVGYFVEYTRVGDITNLEKLSVTIETNGTISPKEAVYEANKILMDHFEIIAVNTEGNPGSGKTDKQEEKEVTEEETEPEEAVEEQQTEEEAEEVVSPKKSTKKKAVKTTKKK